MAILPNRKLILLYALSAQDPSNNQYNSLSIHTKRGSVAIPNFWPLQQNETLSEKQSNITISNQTITSSSGSTFNSTASSGSSSSITNQTSIIFPPITFPPQNNNNNTATGGTTTTPPPQHNQTIIVIPPFFPSSSSPVIGNNNNNGNHNNNGSAPSSSGKPGKEKPIISIQIARANQLGASGSLFIVVANLFIMQMLLAFL